MSRFLHKTSEDNFKAAQRYLWEILFCSQFAERLRSERNPAIEKEYKFIRGRLNDLGSGLPATFDAFEKVVASAGQDDRRWEASEEFNQIRSDALWHYERLMRQIRFYLEPTLEVTIRKDEIVSGSTRVLMTRVRELDKAVEVAKRRYREEQKYSQIVPAEESIPASATESKEFRASQDYRSVRWGKYSYTFSSAQAGIIRALHEAYKNGTPDVGGAALLEGVNSYCKRLFDLFRKHPAWKTLVVSTSKGAYRLALKKS